MFSIDYHPYMFAVIYHYYFPPKLHEAVMLRNFFLFCYKQKEVGGGKILTEFRNEKLLPKS